MPGSTLTPAALDRLRELLDRRRAAIVDAGTDWITAQSLDLQGRRPRAETRMLVDREFDAYRALLIDGDPAIRDAFVEFTTTLRATSEFRISTLLRGFLCFRRGVEAILESEALGAEARLEIIRALDEAYFDTAFVMADVYAAKLLEVLQRTQEQLMQREKLAALGGLVAGVAHEINTPMGVAVTAASLLRDRLRGLAADFEGGQLRKRALGDFLRDADEAAALTLGNLERASELVASFKQVAVDQSHASRRRLRLGPYIRETLASLTPLYKRTPHRLALALDDAIEAELDPGAISQILTNLIQNALSHAFDDAQAGTITITLARVGDQRAALTVADDGRGLSPEERRRIFEPFFTTRRGSGGSGLGMHIVHNLVSEALGGVIRVDSAPGEGTAVRIEIPLAPAPASASASASTSGPAA